MHYILVVYKRLLFIFVIIWVARCIAYSVALFVALSVALFVPLFVAIEYFTTNFHIGFTIPMQPRINNAHTFLHMLLEYTRCWMLQ